MRLDLLPLGLRLVVETLQDLRVLAGVNGEHAAVQEGTVFLSDRFILVLRVYVFEYLLGIKWVAIEVIAFDPQSWREVVLIIIDVDTVLAEIFLPLLQSLLATDLQKAPLIPLAFHDLLLRQLPNAAHRSRRGNKVLLLGRQQLTRFAQCLLPLPPEVSQLVARLQKLFGREHALSLVILIRGGELGVEEVLDAVEHDYV